MRIANRHSTSDDATCEPTLPCRGGVTKRAAVKVGPHRRLQMTRLRFHHSRRRQLQSDTSPSRSSPSPSTCCFFSSCSRCSPVRSWRAALLRARSGCGSTSEDPGATRPWRRSHAAHRCRGMRGAGLPATRAGADGYRSVVRRLAQAGAAMIRSRRPERPGGRPKARAAFGGARCNGRAAKMADRDG